MSIPSHLREKITTQLPASTATHILGRFGPLGRMVEVDDERSASLWPASEVRNSRLKQARENFEITKANHARGLTPDSEAREAEIAYNERKKRNNVESAKADEISQQAANSMAVLNSTTRLMNGKSWQTKKKSLAFFENDKYQPDPAEPGPEVTLVHIGVEGEPRAMVEEQRAAVLRYKSEIDEVENAPMRIATAKRIARQQVEELAARGAPVMAGAAESGDRLSIRPPRLDIGAMPGPDTDLIPKAPDALALIAWAMPANVLAAAEASIDSAYLGIDLQLDPHERQRRRREIKAEILAAERIECAAIWRMIEAGDENVRFRPDTDPRAILGIA